MYVSKTVKFQHRIATGKAGLKMSGSGIREHVPTPTKLETVDALVLSEVHVEGLEPRLFLLYSKDDQPVIGTDWQTFLRVAPDVPHRDHDGAQENEMFWWDQNAELVKAMVARTEQAKLVTLPRPAKDSK
jgi:hypothetical protein